MEGRVWGALDDTNPADPLHPGACPKLVFRLRETLFLALETPWGMFSGAGRVHGGMKSSCGNGGPHSLGFPHKNTVVSYVKTLGRLFGGMKKRRRQLAPAIPRF